MKTAIGNIVSLVTDNETRKNFEWNEILVKFGVLAIAVYLIVTIDVIVYGYLTR